MRKIFVSLATVVVLSAAITRSEPLTVTTNRYELEPGQTLRLQWPIRSDHAPSMMWHNKDTTALRSFDHYWRILIPIPIDEPEGEEVLYVTSNSPLPNENFEGPINIKIRAATFSKSEHTPGREICFIKEQELTKKDDESMLIDELIKVSAFDEDQYWRSLFVPPTSGRILRKFGLTKRKLGEKKENFHTGVDLGAPDGEPIVAPNDGIVLLTKEFDNHGKTVLINHGQGVLSLCYPLGSILVKEGERVSTSQIIGTAGIDERLHWELTIREQPVDPLQWVQEVF